MAETPETTHFGFTRVGPTESRAKNGYNALDLDLVTIDAILQALADHNHSAAPKLADPTEGPDLTLDATAGALPAGTTLYYKIGLVDAFGLETAASSEVSISTPDPLDAPTAPAAALEATGGTLATAGRYSYRVSFRQSNGTETEAGSASDVTIESGATNRVRLDLPSLPADADSYAIHRARPGQSQYYFLKTHSGSTVVYDDGTVAEDSTILAPTLNDTNSTNSVVVALPGSVDPDELSAWRIYRSTQAGRYPTSALVHKVVETVSASDTTVVSEHTDDGSPPLRGFPRSRSATLSGGKVIDLTQLGGKIPLDSLPRGGFAWDTHVPGEVLDAKVYNKTRIPRDVQPAQFTAFFRDLPSGLAGATQVRFVIRDSGATPTEVELICDDDTGYYLRSWPITDAGSFEAESGTRSNPGFTPIRLDETASNGEAVELDANLEWVQVSLGVLDPGDYQCWVTVKAIIDAAGTPDMSVEVIEDPDGAATVLATAQLDDVTQATYTELAGPDFTVTDGTQTIVIRATLDVADGEVVYVDSFRYAAELLTLVKGDIELEAFIDGTPVDAGGYVQVSLWY